MARILLVHRDRKARKFIEERASVHHEVRAVDSLGKATRAIATTRPQVLLAEINGKSNDALDLLRYMKRNRIDLPVILVGGARAGMLKHFAMKLGAKAYIEYPMEQHAFDEAISGSFQADREAHGGVPPITREERDANISELEKDLNRHMVCIAGKNQVYIQALIEGMGRTSKPRVALKCQLRKQFGHPPDVYYEYIRDMCCGDPTACPAFQEFQERNSA